MEIEGGDVNLSKRIVDLEIQCGQLKEEIIDLEQGVMEANDKEAKIKHKYSKVKERCLEMKESLDSERSKRREEVGQIRVKYWNSELQKRTLEIDLAMAKNKDRNETSVNPWVTEDQMFDQVSKKLKLEEQKNLELNHRIQSLDKEKELLAAQVSQLKREKGEEVDRILIEKMCFEEESKKKHLILLKKIDSMEENTRVMVAKFSQANAANMEKQEEIRRIHKEKMDLKEQGEKIILEKDELIKLLSQKIETYEAEKKEIEKQKAIMGSMREENVDMAIPAALNQGNIGGEEQTTLASDSKIKGPLVRKLTGGRSHATSIDVDRREPLPRKLTGDCKRRPPLLRKITGGSIARQTRSGSVYGMDL